MGDVQSGEWTLESVRAHQECANTFYIQMAEAILNDASRAVYMAEEQLENARLDRQRALGRLEVAKFQPKRHQVLNPPMKKTGAELYTLCTQLGYTFCINQGKVHFVGSPSDGLINTGLILEDLPG